MAGLLGAAAVSERSAAFMRADNLRARVLVRPANTAEVSKVLSCCHRRGLAVVTHGGLTGLVHGTEAVEQHDLNFPLDLGARGSATMGGIAAANAGGNRVLRYGMARQERDALWSLRDDVGQVAIGGEPVIFDISLPISRMQAYTEDLAIALRRGIGEHRLWIFGHLGDGNLHVIVQIKPQDRVLLRPRVEALVYGPLAAFRGAVSAEHGIGLEKMQWLSISRSEQEIALMRIMKQALDPKGVLNPGKLVAASP